MTAHERFWWISQRAAELIPEIAKGRPVTPAIVRWASLEADRECALLYGSTDGPIPAGLLSAQTEYEARIEWHAIGLFHAFGMDSADGLDACRMKAREFLERRAL